MVQTEVERTNAFFLKQLVQVTSYPWRAIPL